jgi:PAS domain S-box-containing protein
MALEMLLGPSDRSTKADRARRVAVVRSHLLTMAGAAVIIAALPIVSGPLERRLALSAFLLLATAIGWIPLRLGHPRLASLVCLLDFGALIFGVSLFAGGILAPAFSALLVVSAAAAALLSWRAAVVSSVIGVLGGFALLLLELSGRLPASTVVHTPETIFGAYALFLVLITVPLAVSSRNAETLLARLDVELLERRRVEERLRESEARLKAIVENTSVFLGLLATDGLVLVTNRQSPISLLPRKEVVGRWAWEMPLLISRPEPAAWVRSAVARAAAGEICRRTYSEPGPDGTPRHYEVEIRPVCDDGGRIDFLIAETRDVTELQSLIRMKDQFLAVAAHELKTPVTIMKGCAQTLLRADEGHDTPRRRLLSAIDRGADRIDRVVRNLLDVSRLQMGQLELEVESLTLSDLVAEVAEKMALTAPGRRIAVEAAQPQLSAVRGDRYRLEQAFAVIIDNAVRYSPDGGDVRISIAEAGGEVVVSVRDEGIGIPASVQSRVFERFFRAHTGTPHDYGGMGVGLYIANEIVGRHGGRIWLDSVEGAGSTFHIALPHNG